MFTWYYKRNYKASFRGAAKFANPRDFAVMQEAADPLSFSQAPPNLCQPIFLARPDVAFLSVLTVKRQKYYR